MAAILFIHKRSDVCQALAPIMKNHRCAYAPSIEAALENLKGNAYDVIALDIDLPLDLSSSVQELAKSRNNPHILGVAGACAPEKMEQALRAGLWDVLCAPFAFEDLEQAINRCLHHRDAKKGVKRRDYIKRDAILGTSPCLNQCLENIATVARSNVSVLLLGETGTGKELFAGAIHANSARSSQNFIVVDCTNIPKTLAESLLFGHERGSFTGAADSRDGLFRQADGGTIFLDEIGDLDIEIQKSLLRVLQNRKFRPLSSKKEISSDFRLVAATNKDLEAMIEEGTFRKDLYHRLCASVIHLPPLRERKEDIQPIANFHVRQICLELQCPEKEISYELHHALTLYDWPGNVRELINALYATVHNAIVENRLYPQHLPIDIRTQVLLKRRNRHVSVMRPYTPSPLPAHGGAFDPDDSEPIPEDSPTASGVSSPDTPPDHASAWRTPPFPQAFISDPEKDLPPLRTVRESAIHQMEAAYLEQLIARSQGDFRQAMDISGLSRARLYDLLNKHQLSIGKPGGRTRGK